MKFFAIHIEDLESEKFLASTNDQIANWLLLHALCSKQANGGVIADAASIPERFWMRHGIDKDVIDKPSPLWSWSEAGLSIEPYDIDGQTLFERKVLGGKAGAAKRWNGTNGGSESGSPNGSPNRPNITQHNITSDKKKRSVSTFQKPTAQVVAEYGSTLTPAFSAIGEFMDHYDSNGWKVGKTAMKDWKATVRKWNRNQQAQSQPKTRELRANDCCI